jgi:predicted aspartyl protease
MDGVPDPPVDPAAGGRGLRLLMGLAVLLAAVAVILPLAWTTSGAPIPPSPLALPSFPATCSALSPVGTMVSTIPMKEATNGPLKAEVVPVCIAGQGPFPFIVDTGAAASVVSTTLADQLQLAAEGSPIAVGGVGCSGTVQPVTVPSWSVGPVQLGGQLLLSTGLAVPTAHGASIDGLIGSDVLSRFGAVRFDFQRHQLVVAGAEGHASDGTPTSAAVAAADNAQATLAGTGLWAQIAVHVQWHGPYAQAQVPVRIGGATHEFVLDTGAALSAVSPTTARAASLTRLGGQAQLTGIGCTTTVALYKSGTWSVGGDPLRPQAVAEVSVTGGQSDVAGLLGSDALTRFPWFVLNYDGGRLLLGDA